MSYPLVIASVSPKFRLAILMVLQSSAGALHLYAPVCSSWTRISRGTSWRTCINAFGDLTSCWVRSANQMVSRRGHGMSKLSNMNGLLVVPFWGANANH